MVVRSAYIVSDEVPVDVAVGNHLRYLPRKAWWKILRFWRWEEKGGPFCRLE